MQNKKLSMKCGISAEDGKCTQRVPNVVKRMHSTF